MSACRLPSIVKLNGSIVADGEREDSERFFIRYYMEFPEEEVPLRYAFFVMEWRAGQKGSKAKGKVTEQMVLHQASCSMSCLPQSVLVNVVVLEYCLMTCRITSESNLV